MRRTRKQAIVTATTKVRCGKAWHRVSLLLSGRLIFHDHDKEDIRRRLSLCELGDDATGCFEVLQNWKSANKLPTELAYFRYKSSESPIERLVWRLQRRMSFRRQDQEVRALIPGYGNDLTDITHKYAAILANNLRVRGYRADYCGKRVYFYPGQKEKSLALLFHWRSGDRGYCVVNANEYLSGGNDCCHINKTNVDAPPWRHMADFVERRYLTDLLTATIARNLQNQRLYITDNLVKLREGLGHVPGSRLSVEWYKSYSYPRTDYTLISLSIGGLNLQSAELVAKQLTLFLSKINRIENASHRRSRNPNHFPPEVNGGIGPDK
jgi:hypothetical protein